ncbi:TPA: YSIRK-targeted surface antigen transcriptional regulator [Streptococcus agalactiae]|nr:YSIRK-targeted surface antigen transcriptional regulator [Streptococcus agalactiae]
MIDFLLLKSLHSLLGLTITVCDQNFSVIREYKSEKTISLFYNHYLILSNSSKTQHDFLFHYGSLGELFLVHHIQQYYIIIGPWRSNVIDPLLLKKKLTETQINASEQNYFIDRLSQLPFFSLSQIRELLIVTNYCLTGVVKDKLSEPLHYYTKGWSNSFDLDKIKQFSKQNMSSYKYQYHFENNILKAVKSGSEFLLKETVEQFSNSIVPIISGDELRSEKNYSIMIYDRLSQATIQAGLDIETAYRARDRFIKENESTISLNEVLKLRDTAILFYTQQVHSLKKHLETPHSQTIVAVIRYLENNLNRFIKTEEIAKECHMSESKLRKLFKQEKHITIQQYFLNLKIEAAKQLLDENKKVEEVSNLLGFSTSSNFSRTFKKIVGISPLEYKQKPKTI